MNAKSFSIVLFLVALGLGIGWFVTGKRASDERIAAAASIAALSNNVVATDRKLTEQTKVNANLESTLGQRAEALAEVSNKLTAVSGELAKTEAEAKAAAEKAKTEIEARNTKIAELEGQKDDLTKKMDGLNDQITGLAGQIKETERKLAASEGDRDLLQKELKRLLAEKAELERKFQDLAALRDQVRKLKEELSIANRLDFIRRSLYGFDKKGAQSLSEGVRSPGSKTTNSPVQLNAEIGTDGSSKVTTPPTAPAPK
jgi:chromosome segregation ATPase